MIVAYNALAVRPGVADGAATFSLNVVPELAAALPEHRLVALVRPGEDRLEARANLTLRPVAGVSSLGRRIRFELLELRRCLDELAADVLVLPSELVVRGGTPVVVVAQNLAYHCDRHGVSFVGATPRDRLGARLQRAYYRALMPVAFRRAARVAAVSHTAADVLSRRAGLDLGKTSVIGEGADSRLLPPPGIDAHRDDRLLIVSALAPYKGIDRALRIFGAVRRRLPGLQLDVVGGSWRGYGRVLRAEVARLGLDAHVHFHEHASARELAAHYQRAALLVHLSECESFGLPVVEAMRYRLPVAAADRPWARETGGEAVLVLPDHDAAAADTIVSLLHDRAQQDALAARGALRAAKLTWRATADRLAQLVHEAAATAGRG